MVLPTQDAPGSSLNQLHRHGDLDWLQSSSWAGTVSREHCGGPRVFWEGQTPVRGGRRMVSGSGGCSVFGMLLLALTMRMRWARHLSLRAFPAPPVQMGTDKGRHPLLLWSCCSARAQIKEGLFSKPIPG